VNGADTVVALPAENKDQTVVKRRRDSDGGSGGAKKDGSGHGANGAGTNGPPSGPRRAAARNEEVIDVEDDGFTGGRHTHMKYELRDTPGLGECFFPRLIGLHTDFSCFLIGNNDV
jgi:nucleobase transporter 1/2